LFNIKYDESKTKDKCQLTASGYKQKALVAQPADTSPGTLARKLSRRASHHGAIFASHGE
jgi:hypothetical protein